MTNIILINSYTRDYLGHVLAQSEPFKRKGGVVKDNEQFYQFRLSADVTNNCTFSFRGHFNFFYRLNLMKMERNDSQPDWNRSLSGTLPGILSTS